MPGTALDLLAADEAISGRVALWREQERKKESRSSVSSLTDPSQALLNAFGGLPTKSGAVVNSNTALNVPSVLACVSLISGIIARLPLLLRQTTAGQVEEITDHPAVALVQDSPDGVRPAFKWRRAQDAIALLRGNAPTRIIRDRFYQPVALKWLNPLEFELWQTPDGDPYFRYRGEVLYPNQDVLLHTEMSEDGVYGISPITRMRETIGLALTQEEFAARFFSNGASPGLVFTAPASVQGPQLDLIRQEVVKNHVGASNANRFMVIGGGLEAKVIPISNADSQFLESRAFSKREIATAYGVPPHLIGDTEKTTSWGTGIEQQNRGFLDFNLHHRLKQWTGELNMALLTQKERLSGLSFWFDTSELTRGSELERAQAHQVYRNIGAESINDVRRAEDMNALPDAIGGNYDTPFNGNGGTNAADAGGKKKPQEANAS